MAKKEKTFTKEKTADVRADTFNIMTKIKSSYSVREIPLPPFLTKLLKQFQMNSQAYVLSGTYIKYVEPRTPQNRFKAYLWDCQIEDANFHCLRHTFATRCVEVGFDIKSLSEILGHANVNITLNKYVHSSLDFKSSNMNKLSCFI